MSNVGLLLCKPINPCSFELTQSCPSLKSDECTSQPLSYNLLLLLQQEEIIINCFSMQSYLFPASLQCRRKGWEGGKEAGREGSSVSVTQLCIWFECVDELLPVFFQ